MASPFDAAKPLSKTKSPSMSLEQALYEEEQEVLKLIGAKHDPLPPPPAPIGSSRSGSVSKSSMLGPNGSLSVKTTRSSSGVSTRRDLEGILSHSGYQFPVASNALSRASDITGSRWKGAPEHPRRSSSPVPKPSGLRSSPQPSPPPVMQSFDKAYRRLSNTAMAQSGGSLGRLASRSSPRSDLRKGGIEERLEKDKDPDSVIESSSSSDSDSEPSRSASLTQSPTLRSPTSGHGSQDELRYEKQHDRIPQSLSAAAEQERNFAPHF